jgi:dihydrofolate synthase/folylpolyglutamate synthase
MQPSSLADWLEYLEKQHPRAIELGLERVADVAARLDLLAPACRVATVAGTNGKGSTTAVLEALALEAGLSVGLYTSPHLLRYNERVRVNGQPVEDRELIAAFERVEAARGAIRLTYFEFGTLAALDIFSRSSLDLMILEVGLGGRLDAVNIIDPDVAVITSIAIDHEAWLGDDRESIGGEKAGILRPGIKAVLGDPTPPASVERALRDLNCSVVRASQISLPALPDLPLRRENIAAAVGAARILGVSVDEVALPRIVASIQLPGRLQRLAYAGREVLLDVGHNPAAVGNLRRWLETHVTGPRIAFFAALSDKDIHAMIELCREAFDAWYVVGLPGVSRALGVSELAERVTAAGARDVQPCASVAAAWERFKRRHAVGTLVVFGSFHTVAAFMQLMEDERSRS